MSSEFQRRWNRNIGLLGFPAFAVFAAGIVTNRRPIVLAGFAVFAVAMARGVGILWKYGRCPSCNRIRSPKVGYLDTCRYCGEDLSEG